MWYENAGFSAIIDGKEVTEKDFAMHGTPEKQEGEFSGIRALRTMEAADGGGVKITLSLSGLAPHRCTGFCPVTLEDDHARGMHQYVREGWTNRFYVLEPGLTVRPRILMMSDEHGQGLIARSVWPLKFNEYSEIVVEENVAHLRLHVNVPDSYDQDSLVSAPVFLFEGDMNEGLERYTALLPESPRKTPPVVGYNTWDYYFSDISIDAVKENLEVIDKTPFLKEHLKYFTIDDGWQTAWGEWVPNYRFPGGIEAYAELVRSYGMIPGIWTAPLIVNPICAPAIRHLKGYAANALTDPIRDEGSFLLDPTHPEARKAIRALFSGLYKAGIRLFKVDYMSRALNIPRFWDTSAGPYDALRLFCQDIRESIGEDSIFLGCSMPVEACSPYVDCGRTGFDMHNVWGHATWSLEGYQYCWRNQPKLWVNDIDFLLVRGPETDHDDQERNALDPGKHEPNHGRWRGGPDFTELEAQTWAAVVMLTGGNMILSDRLSVLNGNGLDIIRKALENRSETPAVPLDQFVHDYPAHWVQENKEYLINWTDEAQTFEIPLSAPVTELWTEKTLTPTDGKLSLTLPAHGSAVLLKD